MEADVPMNYINTIPSPIHLFDIDGLESLDCLVSVTLKYKRLKALKHPITHFVVIEWNWLYITSRVEATCYI